MLLYLFGVLVDCVYLQVMGASYAAELGLCLFFVLLCAFARLLWDSNFVVDMLCQASADGLR